jgi:hypothetical protein
MELNKVMINLGKLAWAMHEKRPIFITGDGGTKHIDRVFAVCKRGKCSDSSYSLQVPALSRPGATYLLLDLNAVTIHFEPSKAVLLSKAEGMMK